MGNFSNVTTNGTGQTRTHNLENELTVAGTATLVYDNSGNLTTDQNGNTLVYDAWNDLVQAKSGSTVLDAYGYDAGGRRITENPGTLRDLYYSDQCQVVEERIGGAAQVQYVWSAAGQDTLVERDRSPTNNGVLSERLYVQQDANDNVTALVNTSGSVVERYAYQPFGQVLYLSAGFGTLSGSSYASVYLFQGQRFEASTGLGYFRARDYSPALERFAEVDPTTFGSGDVNFYRALNNNPTNWIDPSGRYPEDDDPVVAGIKKAIYGSRYKSEEPADSETRSIQGLDKGGLAEDRTGSMLALAAIRMSDAYWMNMIDGMKNLNAQEKEKVKKAIQQLLDASHFYWPERQGLFGKCDAWVKEYMNRTKDLQRTMREQGMKKYFQVTEMYWRCGAPPGLQYTIGLLPWHADFLDLTWRKGLEARHGAVRIEFADRKSIIYLDDGHLGGVDHSFTPDEVPSRYHPERNQPAPWERPWEEK